MNLQFQRMFLPNTYRLALPLRYQSRHSRGAGTSVTISSSRLSFVSRQNLDLAVRARIEISLEWPALLHGSVALQLVVRGEVIRMDSGMAEVAIRAYTFRTRKQREAA